MKNAPPYFYALALFALMAACKPQAEPTTNATSATTAPTVAVAPSMAASAAPLEVASAAAPSSEKPASAAAPAVIAAVSPAPADGKLYTVVDGTKVDAKTFEGFHTWRAAACDRCHGANQEGMVGPSLVNSLKVLTKDEFVQTIKVGRLEKGMPGWSTNENVMNNIDNLYAYLKGRSDGAITQARVSLIQ